jgi:hypothetical protein
MLGACSLANIVNRHAFSRNPAPPLAFGLFERRILTLKSDKRTISALRRQNSFISKFLNPLIHQP